jgi:hypothetical protein
MCERGFEGHEIPFSFSVTDSAASERVWHRADECANTIINTAPHRNRTARHPPNRTSDGYHPTHQRANQ